MDNVSQSIRSRTMSRIHATNTSPEIKLRKAMWAAGIRGWRNNSSTILGHPDIVFKRKKVIIFVDGCFWHGCPLCCRIPTSRREYWESKIFKNNARDKKLSEQLEAEGWIVLRFWEHEIKKNIVSCVKAIFNVIIRSNYSFR